MRYNKDNTGYGNSGEKNVGNYNSGDKNVGDSNTGMWNVGDNNAGNCNTGYRNSGSFNTGDWNAGSYNTGYCNSKNPEYCLIFNKPAKVVDWKKAAKPRWMFFSLTDWHHDYSKPDIEYLKPKKYKQAALDAWNATTDDDRALTFKLPNFDKEVFMEIFGFDPEEKSKKKITIDGKDIYISHDSYEELKKSLGV